MSRWAILITAEDSGEQLVGLWRNAEKATHIARRLRERSSRYTGNPEHASYDVSLLPVEPWRGMKNAIRSE